MLLPYKCFREGNSYFFTTDFGLKYRYYFTELDKSLNTVFIHDFGFEIENRPKRVLPDPRVRITLICALEEFFRKNTHSIVFTCYSEDGRASVRKKVFQKWFESYAKKDVYLKLDYTLETKDGNYYASYITSVNNPYHLKNKASIEEFVEALKRAK